MALETDDARDHQLTEKMYHDIADLFDAQVKIYKILVNETPDEDITGKSVKLDYMLKFAASCGYVAQVHAGLSKAYHLENTLADIQKRLEKIPPDVLKEYLKV